MDGSILADDLCTVLAFAGVEIAVAAVSIPVAVAADIAVAAPAAAAAEGTVVDLAELPLRRSRALIAAASNS